jgi:DNA-binding response OmpR family regulator
MSMPETASVPEGLRTLDRRIVLVVEDEEDLRNAIRDILRAGGCAVDTAGSVAEALRHVLGRDYDVVISDVHLTKSNGIELARLLSRRIRSPRIILMTADPAPELVLEGYGAGASQVLSKPVSLTLLLRTVEEAPVVR